MIPMTPWPKPDFDAMWAELEKLHKSKPDWFTGNWATLSPAEKREVLKLDKGQMSEIDNNGLFDQLHSPPWPKPETYEGPKYYNPDSGEWTTGGLKWNGGYAVSNQALSGRIGMYQAGGAYLGQCDGVSISLSNNLSVAPPMLGPGEEVRIKSNGRTIELKFTESNAFAATIREMREANDRNYKSTVIEPRLRYTLPPRISTRRKHAGQIAFAMMLACWVLYVVFTFGR